jgi:hypothetical protein
VPVAVTPGWPDQQTKPHVACGHFVLPRLVMSNPKDHEVAASFTATPRQHEPVATEQVPYTSLQWT